MTIDIRTEQEFNSYARNRGYRLTLVKFGAKWCQPCQQIKVLYDDLSRRHVDIQFLAVDVDALPLVAALNQVNSVPQILVFKNGIKTNETMVGAKPHDLVQIVKQNSIFGGPPSPPPPPPPAVTKFDYNFAPNNFAKSCVIL
jgi:thiol-disulfide isomerase/thioredoxin